MDIINDHVNRVLIQSFDVIQIIFSQIVIVLVGGTKEDGNFQSKIQGLDERYRIDYRQSLVIDNMHQNIALIIFTYSEKVISSKVLTLKVSLNMTKKT